GAGAGAGAETIRDRSMTRNPWLTFRVSDILIANSIGVNNSGHIAWSPQFKPLGFPIGARLQVGMTAFTTTTSEVFIVPEAQLFAEYPFSPIVTVEVGGGAQYWTQGDVALRSLISVQGNYLLPEAWFKVVRGLFAGISFSPGIVSNWQMRLGADIEF
ncbi:MAG: hypothetical protein ABI041_04955, partial [Bdellovibrionia bacterium]